MIMKTGLFASASLLWASTLMNTSSGIVDSTPPMTISDVSKDRFEFEPQKGEKLTLSYHISARAKIAVRFVGPFGTTVRTLHQQAKKAGLQKVVWNGLDDSNRPISAEAYTYTITAASMNATTTVTTYDPSRTTGGEALPPENADIDRDDRYITYKLSKPARVRMQMSRGPVPIGTLIDWVPRAPGTHREYWEADIDPFKGAGKLPPIGATFNAFALPENSVIVKGTVGQRPPALSQSPVPHRLDLDLQGDEIQVHALHPRARCYDPLVEITFPEDIQKTSTGLPWITDPTVLRFDLAPHQRPGHLTPIPRASVSIYVDGTRVDGQSASYLPYNWVLDPSLLTSGEHVISGVVSWKDDHHGFVYVRIFAQTREP